MGTAREKLVMLGGSGLVGSRLKELLSVTYDVTSFSLETGVDITRPETLSPLRENSGATLLHLAAKADVDACEKDQSMGENGDAWRINVLGTENVARACSDAGHRMIYVSTDFVFDGANTPSGGYGEEDAPNPTNWYATTKYEGEKRTQSASASNVIMRISYPYRAKFDAKSDFVRALLSRLRAGQEVKAVTDHLMTPTYIDDIAKGIDAIIRKRFEGIIHVVGSSSLSPFDACIAIARAFSLENPTITKVKRAEFFHGRAPRPFNLTLKNDKIKHLGVQMMTFEEGLKKIATDL